jgi:Protein of unknown function (DUF2652)
MENKGLLFIPDISGFTDFVINIELVHSGQIIQELLELLIASNEVGLDISEVEGDAILFYKFGDLPDLAVIYEQVEKMFNSFHQQLKLYEKERTCDCRACASAINLSLKIITHYGEFTEYNIKNFTNLIGKDVIVAHLLLKNNIAGQEYWLVTTNSLKEDKPVDYREWMKWEKSFKQTEHGDVHFHFTDLGSLKK